MLLKCLVPVYYILPHAQCWAWLLTGPPLWKFISHPMFADVLVGIQPQIASQSYTGPESQRGIVVLSGDSLQYQRKWIRREEFILCQNVLGVLDTDLPFSSSLNFRIYTCILGGIIALKKAIPLGITIVTSPMKLVPRINRTPRNIFDFEMSFMVGLGMALGAYVAGTPSFGEIEVKYYIPPGSCFNVIKIVFRGKGFHCKDKTVTRSFYFIIEIPMPLRRYFLHCDRPQKRTVMTLPPSCFSEHVDISLWWHHDTETLSALLVPWQGIHS